MRPVEERLAELPDGGGPRRGWQERVLARVADREPVPRRPLLLLAGLATGLVATSAVAFALLGTGDSPGTTATAAREAVEFLLRPGARAGTAAREAAERSRLVWVQRRADEMQRQKEETIGRLLAARTDAEKAAAEAKVREAVARMEEVRTLLVRLKARARKGRRPAPQDGKVVAKCDPNDPLCAIE